MKTRTELLDDGRAYIEFWGPNDIAVYIKLPLDQAIEMLDNLKLELQGIKTLAEQ